MASEVYVADGNRGLRLINALNPCGPLKEAAHLGGLGPVGDVTAPQAIRLPLTSVLFELFFWALLFFPIVGLSRLLHNRAVLRRTLGSRFSFGADWPLWIALLLLCAWTALQVGFLRR
jgi:hypothetical protein